MKSAELSISHRVNSLCLRSQLSLLVLALCVAASACVTPVVTQPLDPKIDFRKFKTVSFTVTDNVGTTYSKETANLLAGLLGGRLKTFGYTVSEQQSDFSLQIFVDEANQGDKAAMFFIGFGAGRSLLSFTALFRDAMGDVIARFTGGKSFHGGEIGGSALWMSHEDMQIGMVGEAVRQIARFIETNGKLE